MSVPQPNFLLTFNESSGTAVTNYGSTSGGYTVTQGTSPTNYEWNPNASHLLAFLDVKTKSGGSMPYLTTAATVPLQELIGVNCAVGFQIQSLSTSSQSRLVSPSASGDGDVAIFTDAPSAGGDFDLLAQFRSVGSLVLQTTFTALTFNTDYRLACSIDVSTPSAAQARFKLGAGSVVTPATADWTSQEFDNAWPYIGRRSDFNNHFGLDALLYYWAYQRGTAWSSGDLGDINTDPSAAITGWPGGGGGGTKNLLAGKFGGPFRGKLG